MLYELIDVLIGGVANGAVYAIMAIGMALVFGVTRIFNLGYGSLYSLGGYLAWFLFKLKFNYLFVWITSIPLLFAAGFVIERLTIHPLLGKKGWDYYAVVSTLGLALVLDNAYLILFGPYLKSLPPLLSGGVDIMGFVISKQDITNFIVSLVITAVFMGFMKKTRIGLALQAIAQDMTGAQIVGIDRDRLFGYSFAISTVLAGIAAILLAPKYFVSPGGGWTILLKAWVIMAFGGQGSIRGSFYAAFILGIAESLVGWQLGFAWNMVVWCMILVLTLIFRPQGLLGKWG